MFNLHPHFRPSGWDNENKIAYLNDHLRTISVDKSFDEVIMKPGFIKVCICSGTVMLLSLCEYCLFVCLYCWMILIRSSLSWIKIMQRVMKTNSS